MKKLLSALMCVILTAAMFAGCGASTASKEVADATAEIQKELEDAAKELSEELDKAASETTEAPKEIAPSAAQETGEEPAEETPEATVTVDPYDIGYEDVSDEDFEITEYRFDTTLGSAMFFYVVKNNTGKDVSVQINGHAYDASGELTEDAMASIDVLGADETSICYLYFTYGEEIDKVEYEVKSSEDIYGTPVLNDILYEGNVVDNNSIVLRVTNEGEAAAVYLQAYGLFFDEDDNLIAYANTYFTDADSELKPGAEIFGELVAYQEFDHALVYFSGAAGTNWFVDETFDSEAAVNGVEVTGAYLYESDYSTEYFLELTNNSGMDLYPCGNIVAYDRDGNMIGATNSYITMLGDGETGLMQFYFGKKTAEVNDIQYSLSYTNPYGTESIQKDIEVSAEEAGDKISVTLVNNGELTATYPEVSILFLDADGNVCGYETCSPANENYELPGGEEATAEVYVPEEYDSYKVYLLAYADSEAEG